MVRETKTISNSFDKNETAKKKSIWDSLKKLRTQVQEVFTGEHIDANKLIKLEEILILSDTGPKVAAEITKDISERTKYSKKPYGGKITTVLLKEIIKEKLNKLVDGDNLEESLTDAKNHNRLVPILIVGVNGSGKTTTIGKLANYYQRQNFTVALAACDTFRAAANEQLIVWGARNSIDVFQSKVTDPAAVAFEAIQSSKKRKTDILLIDTAGRLPNNKNLIEELKKIRRVISKVEDQPKEHTWIVIDANTGQNAISQIKQFREAIDITGIILTKFDGTSKAGFLLQLADHDQIPIHFVGHGEKITDIVGFSPEIISSGIVGTDPINF